MPNPLGVPRLDAPGPPPVVLRPWTADDLGAVRLAAEDPLVSLITSVPACGDEQDCRAWIARQHERARERIGWSFAVDDGSGTAVGQIGLWPHPRDRKRASIGYWLVGPARGGGRAAAALALLAGWAVTPNGDDTGERPFERLEIYVEPWNVASWHTAERCGFRREGLMRSWETVGGQRRDMYMYARLRTD